jgi:hypothetical protein
MELVEGGTPLTDKIQELSSKGIPFEDDYTLKNKIEAQSCKELLLKNFYF